MPSRDKILHDMSELWKEIFHDSDDYIRLVINDRLDLNLCQYRYDNSGRMTSMIIGIPYLFVGDNNTFRALYLCGICTIRSNRGNGEFQELLSTLECRAKSMNFDFIFLIPANEKLRHFYCKLYFEDMGEKVQIYDVILPENIQNINQNSAYIFSSDKSKYVTVNIVSVDDIPELLNAPDVLKLLHCLEAKSGKNHLVHSVSQWQSVCEDWLLSGNFISIEAQKNNHENSIFERGWDTVCKYSNFRIMSISFIRVVPYDHDDRNSESNSYGMMKRLSDFNERSSEFGISFMMDE